MVIGGFQKLTLLDYPGSIACIVFTKGCNFRCPFCQNAPLVLREQDMDCVVDPEEVFSYLKKRRRMLEGVVITGGEPLLWPELIDFLRKIRALGFCIKLDTNGSFPDRLGKLLDENLLDYVAMDIKQAPERYAAACGIEEQNVAARVDQSLQLLRKAKIAFELRTTLVKGIHSPEDIEILAKWIAGPEPYYLQSYEDNGYVLLPQGLSAFSRKEIQEMAALARRYCPKTVVRSMSEEM